MPEATFDLLANTQLTFHSLRIGMAGIAAEDFVDATDANQNGLRAGLWIFYREDPTQDCVVRVHAGQSLTVAGYQIDVLTIQPDKPSAIKLRLTLAPSPG